MHNMFLDSTKLTNLILSNWDTSKVTDMHSMFENDSSLTIVIKLNNLLIIMVHM